MYLFPYLTEILERIVDYLYNKQVTTTLLCNPYFDMMITFYMEYVLILIILNLLLQALYVNGQVCNIGEYSTNGSSPCTSCFTGYTTSSTGSTDYSDCNVCNAGYYGTSITTAMSGACSVPWSRITTSGT